MKKYLMMVVVALMATTGVKAQNEEMTWSFMPKVGWNLCTWAGDPDAWVVSRLSTACLTMSASWLV